MKEIKISRKRWLRGTGLGSLLDGNNKMCCLGFVSRAGGLTRKQILNESMPSSVCHTLGKILLPELVHKDSGGYYLDKVVSNKLSSVNDDSSITDDIREKQLTKLAAEAGFKFVFVP